MQIYAMISSDNTAILPVFSTDVLYVKETDTKRISSTDKALLLFVLQEDWNGEAQIMVDKMMKACKFESSDYEVITCQEARQIWKPVQAETVICFGVTFDQSHFRMNRPLNKPFRFHTCKWLLTHRISDLLKQDQLKATLWNDGLKPLFQI